MAAACGVGTGGATGVVGEVLSIWLCLRVSTILQRHGSVRDVVFQAHFGVVPQTFKIVKILTTGAIMELLLVMRWISLLTVSSASSGGGVIVRY